MSRPGSVIPSARAKAQPGCSAHWSKQPGGRRAPRALTSPPSTPGSPDGEGPTRPPSPLPHSILDVSWRLLTNGALYDDPGARFFELRHDPAVEAKRLQRRIEGSEEHTSELQSRQYL